MLESDDKEGLKKYLIMERIYPPMMKAFMFRNGQIIEGNSLSELGIFSSVFIDNNKPDPVQNITFGRLMRTKGSHSNEGGVNAGFAVIDQPLLVDMETVSDDIMPCVDKI